MQEKEATPLPWYLETAGYETRLYDAEHHYLLGARFDPNRQERSIRLMSLIVRAVNREPLYEKLLEAAKEVYEQERLGEEMKHETFVKLRAAIAALEGGSDAK